MSLINKISSVLLLILIFGCTSPIVQRYPAKAGSWYSNNKKELEEFLRSIMDKAGQNIIRQDHAAKLTDTNPTEIHKQVLAIICPHAAYRFSGQAAAHSFKLIEGRKFGRVFVLGPMHKKKVANAILTKAKIFSTPLGNLKVDTDTVDALLKSPFFTLDESAHQIEYSLEMELPFVQVALGPDTKIVPIIIGRIDDVIVAQKLADTLRENLKADDLIIVSSDFTHYGARYDFEPFKDHVAENIQNLDKEAFSQISRLDAAGLESFQRQTGNHICGIRPIFVLLRMLPKNTQVTLLDYFTSDAVPYQKPKDGKPWSVSYMAISFSGDPWKEASHGQ